MKKTLLIVLFISLGFSQQIIPQITETYDNGNVKNITYHKKSRTGIEKVKYEKYYKYDRRSQKKLIRIGDQMDYGLGGMRMDRRNQNKIKIKK